MVRSTDDMTMSLARRQSDMAAFGIATSETNDGVCIEKMPSRLMKTPAGRGQYFDACDRAMAAGQMPRFTQK